MKVNKIKEKVAAKVAKGKAKVAAKCGKAKKACAMLVMAAQFVVLAGCMAGCKMGEQPTAQRAQTANTHVTYIVEDGGRATFNYGAEFVSQAQANETSGTETMSNAPKNTPTVTTDTDTALDIPVNKGNAGTSAAGGAAERLLGAGADRLSGKLGDTKITPTATVAPPSASDSAACPDGSCNPGGCVDGACNPQ